MPTRGCPRCVILGGGGHAKVLVECLRESAVGEPAAILDADRSLWGTELLGIKIRGGDDILPELFREGVLYFAMGVGSVKDNRPRKQLFEMAMAAGLRPLSTAHPSAVISPSAAIGEGTVLFPLSVVGAQAKIGKNVIINTGAIVEHDCVIGDHAHMATGARLAGGVRVAEAAHIGAGATVLQGLCVGQGAVVGAGAVVVRDVEPWTVVVGIPAKILRQQVPA